MRDGFSFLSPTVMADFLTAGESEAVIKNVPYFVTYRLAPARHSSRRCMAACSLSGWFSADHGLPVVARVIVRHGQSQRARRLAEIFLIDGAVLADEEGHDARIPVFRGIGQNGKTARHVSVHDVIHRAAFRLISLAGEYAVVIAIEGLWFTARAGVTDSFREITQRAQGTRRLTFRHTPVEPVLLTFITYKS